MTIRNRINIWLKGKIKIRRDKKMLSKMKSVGCNIHLGDNFSASSPQKMCIGSNTWIGNNFFAKCEGGLSIGSGVIISKDAEIWTANHCYDATDLQSLPYDTRFIKKPVSIGDNVWIGSRVTIVPGVKIGEGCVVGAGSVVSHNIPPLAVVGGNPAKIIKYRDKDTYEKLKAEGKIYLDMEYNYDVSTLRKSEYLKNAKQ